MASPSADHDDHSLNPEGTGGIQWHASAAGSGG